MRWLYSLRPKAIVESTRWLFAALARLSLLPMAGQSLGQARGAARVVAVAALAVLMVSWSRGLAGRTAPFTMDLVDTVAILAFSATCSTQFIQFTIVFPALWFRSLYGSSSIASMFLAVVIIRQLAGSLRAREETAHRDAAVAAVGPQLLGVTVAAEIRRLSWEAITTICGATPGMRVLSVVADGAALRVEDRAGHFVTAVRTLPAGALYAPGQGSGSDSERVLRTVELDVAVGTGCDWEYVALGPLPAIGGLIVGSPRDLGPEVLVAVRSVVNLMALALCNSQVHEDLTQQAQFDSLTGLANRATFTAALSAALVPAAWGAAQLTAVLFIDLDDFKNVNDGYGHQAGDDLLREIAARLRRAVRPQDLCARLGGDEFAVLLHHDQDGDDPAKAALDVGESIARRVVEAVAAPVWLGSSVVHVGASIGVAPASAGIGLEQLIQQADVAMYAAKANGKGRVETFDEGQRQSERPRRHPSPEATPPRHRRSGVSPGV